MNTPQKTILALGVAGLAAPFSAFGLNTSDLTAYIGSAYLGAETVRQSGDFNRGLLSSSQGVSLGGAYGDHESDEGSDRRFDADFDVTTASLGYVHEFEEFKLVASLTYVDTDFSSDGTDTNPNVSLDTDGDGFFFALGAAKTWDKLEILLQGGAGKLSLDSERVNGSFNQKSSDYDVSLYYFSVTAQYDLYQSDAFGVKPFVELGYMSLENDGFSETDSPDTVSVKSFEDEVPYVQAGADFEYLGFENLSPYLLLAVWHDFGDDSVDIKGTDPVDAPYATEVPDAAEALWSATLGLGYSVAENFDVDALVGIYTSDDLSGTYVGLVGTFTF